MSTGHLIEHASYEREALECFARTYLQSCRCVTACFGNTLRRQVGVLEMRVVLAIIGRHTRSPRGDARAAECQHRFGIEVARTFDAMNEAV
jgi:hypothetical protein